MNEKTKGLIIDIAVYAAAFGIASVPFALISGMFVSTAVFTAVATALIFAASAAFSDVSVYDPYWSVAPPVMVAANIVKYSLFNVNSYIILAMVCIWSARLTANWYCTYRGPGNEDWRYSMYREKCSPIVFQLLSLVGFHFMPTAVVYAGLVSGLLSMREERFSALSLAGVAVMAGAVLLEFVSDTAIHRFIRENRGVKRTCDVSVWRYSRHPNYLGEMSFWTGMFIYYAALCPGKWYMGLGYLSIIALFLTVSVPMMDRHNLERRSDYADYMKKTSAVLILPNRKKNTEQISKEINE